MPLILAEELDTLTADDILEWERRAGNATEVIDKHNLTTERLMLLESLVRARDEPSQARVVDADELDAKLRQISPRRSLSPRNTASTASTPITAGGEATEEEHVEFMWRMANEMYKELKDIGGRPSRAINSNPGPCPPHKPDRDKEYHVRDHWGREVGQLESELTRWLDFRWCQFRVREDLRVFSKYKEAIYQYREKIGIARIVELQLDRQTKLDEWWEYYIYQHRKRPPLERELEQAKRELESRKEEMRKAERNGSVGVDWSSRAGELVRYDKRISRAQGEVYVAQKRLNVLRVEKSLSDVEKDMMIMQAKEDLDSAQKRLESQKSGELEQLNKEVERATAQARLRKQQGKVDHANTNLVRLDNLLEWIAGQFTEIATEYASSGWESQHNRDPLDGWGKYYVYMRERLQAARDGLVEMAEEEAEGRMPKEELHYLQCEQGRVKRKEDEFESLRAWIRREFPEIIAKYAPSGRDSQSKGEHQGGDQATLPHLGPSLIESAHKAPRSNEKKKAQRIGRLAEKRSPLSQVQSSKVSKPIQKRRHPLSEKLSVTRHAVWQLEDHAEDIGEVKEQGPPSVTVRRSKRISQRACVPAPTLNSCKQKDFSVSFR